MEPDIELIKVTKSYGAQPVVRDIDLCIPRGEFVSILGPSGCGKTTTLNMIAGFHAPTHGTIRIRGRDEAGVPPEKRNIGLVFQNYALFPHMTVAENVAFGLRMQGRSPSVIREGVAQALRSVHLEGFEARYPKELSGGQQQRTALARAIAPKPSVLLLDEPLSNLDLKLREAMRIELKEIQQALGMTFVYVTHDQEEAMIMSDRIVVMSDGAIEQEGSPGAIYRSPTSAFVADFIGKSNILDVRAVEEREDRLALRLAGSEIELLADSPLSDAGGSVRFCCIRPEAVVLGPGGDGEACRNRLDGEIRKIVNLGSHVEIWTGISAGTVIKASVSASAASGLALDQTVRLEIPTAAITVLAR